MTDNKKDEIKLFNVVYIYDLYIVAKSKEDADSAAKSILQAGEPPMSQTIYDGIVRPTDIMQAWRNEKPFVSGSITDEEYKPYAGATTAEFVQLYLDYRG